MHTAEQRLNVGCPGLPAPEVDTRSTEEVDECAVHTEAGDVAVVDGAGVDHTANPAIEVINKLAVAAVGTKCRCESGLTETCVSITQEGSDLRNLLLGGHSPYSQDHGANNCYVLSHSRCYL